MLKKLKSFGMSFVTAVQQSQMRKASKYSYTMRLENYLAEKGCADVSCVEHWIQEFDRNEQKNWGKL